MTTAEGRDGHEHAEGMVDAPKPADVDQNFAHKSGQARQAERSGHEGQAVMPAYSEPSRQSAESCDLSRVRPVVDDAGDEEEHGRDDPVPRTSEDAHRRRLRGEAPPQEAEAHV